MLKNPFKFLDPYIKEDKDIFFGRNKETDELYLRIFQGNLLTIYGSSGCGKTSLVRCGLSNKFNDVDWFPVFIRRGQNIVKSVENQISSACNQPIKSKFSLMNYTRILFLDKFKPVYLIFDQFEEIFILGNKEERDIFFSEIKELLNSDLDFKIIFIIREEYFARLTEYERIIPDLIENRFRIEEMTRSNAIESVKGPCDYAGIKYDDLFASELIDGLIKDSARIDLPYLQVFMDNLLKKAIEVNSENPFLSLEILKQYKNKGDILSSFLDEQLLLMLDPELALSILKAFVSIDGTKQSATLSSIDNYNKDFGRDLKSEEIENTILRFIELRILKEKKESNEFELRHDVLAAKIYERITIIEKRLIEVKQLLFNRYMEYVKREVLLSEEDLKYILPYENKMSLDSDILNFIQKSKTTITDQKVYRKKVTILVIICLSLAFTISIILLIRSNVLKDKAETALKEAEEQRIRAIKAEASISPFKLFPKEELVKEIKFPNKTAQWSNEIIISGANIYLQLNEIKVEPSDKISILKIDSTTFKVYGVSEKPSIQTYSVNASNKDGKSDTKSFTVQITDPILEENSSFAYLGEEYLFKGNLINAPQMSLLVKSFMNNKIIAEGTNLIKCIPTSEGNMYFKRYLNNDDLKLDFVVKVLPPPPPLVEKMMVENDGNKYWLKVITLSFGNDVNGKPNYVQIYPSFDLKYITDIQEENKPESKKGQHRQIWKVLLSLSKNDKNPISIKIYAMDRRKAMSPIQEISFMKY